MAVGGVGADVAEGGAFFAYGTLRFAAVLLRVVGTSFPAESAELRDFSRRRFREAVYPGIVADPGSSGRGTLYREIDATSLERLDAYEGEQFERVRVSLVVDGESVDAWAYVVRDEHLDALSEEAWDEGDFVARHLQGFLNRL